MITIAANFEIRFTGQIERSLLESYITEVSMPGLRVLLQLTLVNADKGRENSPQTTMIGGLQKEQMFSLEG